MEQNQGAPAPDRPPVPFPTTGDDVDIAIQELGAPADGASVKIFRFDAKSGKFAYLQAVPATDCNLESTRENFGGGRFKFVIIPPGGKNVRTIMQTIAGEPKGNGHSAAPAGDLDDIRSMLARQQETIDKLAQTVRVPSSQDPIETALRIIEVINASRGAAPAAPPVSMKDMLEVFRQGIEIGSAQGGGDVDPMTRVLDNVFPKMLGLMERSVMNDEAKVRALPSRVKLPPASGSASPSVPPQAGAGAPPVPVARPLTDTIRAYARPVAARMEAGRDPACVATWFLEELSDADVSELAGLSASPSFVSDGLALFPDMRAANEGWLSDFLSSLKEQLETGQDDGAQS